MSFPGIQIVPMKPKATVRALSTVAEKPVTAEGDNEVSSMRIPCLKVLHTDLLILVVRFVIHSSIHHDAILTRILI